MSYNATTKRKASSRMNLRRRCFKARVINKTTTSTVTKVKHQKVKVNSFGDKGK